MKMVVFFLFALSLAVPQEIPPAVPFNLVPLDSPHNGSVTLVRDGGTTCGKYFYIPPTPEGKLPAVYFEFSNAGQLLYGRATIVPIEVSKEDITTVLDQKKIVPVVEWVEKAGVEYLVPIISLKEKDFREARPCIPEPKPIA